MAPHTNVGYISDEFGAKMPKKERRILKERWKVEKKNKFLLNRHKPVCFLYFWTSAVDAGALVPSKELRMLTLAQRKALKGPRSRLKQNLTPLVRI